MLVLTPVLLTRRQGWELWQTENLCASRNPTRPTATRRLFEKRQANSADKAPTQHQNGAQNGAKTYKNDTKNGSRGTKMEPTRGQDGVKTVKNWKITSTLQKRWWPSTGSPRFLFKSVASMAPSWRPKSSQNNKRIDEKLDPKTDAL